MSDYMIINGELYHHGVKGMKWGVRRYEKKASKARAKAKEYKMYSDDYDPKNYTVKLKDKERTKLQANSDKYRKMANAENRKARSLEAKAKAAAEKASQPMTKERAKKAAAKGAKTAAATLRTIGMLAVADQLATGGLGRKVVGATVKHTGRAVVSAWVYANGGRDIRWYDN